MKSADPPHGPGWVKTYENEMTEACEDTTLRAGTKKRDGFS
jgi:hypothetical protein